MKSFIFLTIIAALLSGCSSQSVLPDTDEVKTSRKLPSKDCKELGKVMGRINTVKGKPEQALADMKKDAANKGANYVVVKQYSDNGTSVTGIAYQCP